MKLPAKARDFVAPLERDGYRLEELPAAGQDALVLRASVRPASRSLAPLPLSRQGMPADAAACLSTSEHPLPAAAAEMVWRTLRRADTADDAAEALTRFVGSEIKYETRQRSDETAADAWRRRRGSCAGRANLLVAMLRMAGMPARTAHGFTLKGLAPGREHAFGEAMLHRWVEIWRPGGGWRAVDPGEEGFALTPLYVPFQRLPLLGEVRGWTVEVLDSMPGPVPSGAAEARSRLSMSGLPPRASSLPGGSP